MQPAGDEVVVAMVTRMLLVEQLASLPSCTDQLGQLAGRSSVPRFDDESGETQIETRIESEKDLATLTLSLTVKKKAN